MNPNCVQLFLTKRLFRAEEPRVSEGNDGQLSFTFHSERDPNIKVMHQLRTSKHNTNRYLMGTDLSNTRHHLILHSAHDFPSALSAFQALVQHRATYTGL